MKKISFVLAGILSLIILACSKNDDNPIPVPEEPSPALGYWSGTYTMKGMVGSSKCAIYVKPGGSFRFYEMFNASDTAELSPELKTTGTWAMIDDTFMMTLIIGGNTVGVQASLQMNESETQMGGLWQANGETMGKFEFAR